jgi:hypothetical protein
MKACRASPGSPRRQRDWPDPQASRSAECGKPRLISLPDSGLFSFCATINGNVREEGEIAVGGRHHRKPLELSEPEIRRFVEVATELHNICCDPLIARWGAHYQELEG